MKIDIIKKKPIRIVGIIILVLIAIIPSVYFYSQYQKVQQRLQNPEFFAQEERRSLIDKVGKLIQLPTGEEPFVATVSDSEKLKGQPFFANAKNGDKLLVYNNARKAILYDPGVNKIIDVAPINIGPNNSGSPSAAINTTPSPSPQSLKFFLLNGTSKVGLTQKYEGVLKKAIPNAIITDRDNAKKNDYTKSILVDISGTRSKEAEQISTDLNISVGKLPEAETKPTNADFLIILGSDKENL